MTYGKAQSYSDYYKGRDTTPGMRDKDEENPPANGTKSTPTDPRMKPKFVPRKRGKMTPRQFALQRRLGLGKKGK